LFRGKGGKKGRGKEEFWIEWLFIWQGQEGGKGGRTEGNEKEPRPPGTLFRDMEETAQEREKKNGIRGLPS